MNTKHHPAPHTYTLRVSGDFMVAPKGRIYPEGTIIYVDPDRREDVVSGDLVVARMNGDDGVTFRVLDEDDNRRFLRPLNPRYPVIHEEFRILGKVVGAFYGENLFSQSESA